MKKYLLLFIIVSLVACSKKDSNDTTPAPTPTPSQDDIVVSSISPNTGPYSTIVTITGTGFNTTASSNTVKFNGKTATVNSASATQLVVVVPEAAGTGNVTVAWGSKTGTGPVFNFNYTITVSTFAGNGTAGLVNGNSTVSQFNYPIDVDFDSQGNLLVADFSNHSIRKITPAGVSSTVAGTGTLGTTDGNGSVAQFYNPVALTIDNNDNIYVSDQGNARIRKITPAAVVSTIAGSTGGFADGNGTAAQFYYPTGLAIESTGNLYIADQANQRIRKMTPAAVVSTLAGSSVAGFADGTGAAALFNFPTDLTLDGSGNILVCEFSNHTIRKVTPAGVVTTLAGSGTSGSADGTGNTATFNNPFGIAVAADGMIYVGDRGNNLIRQVSPSGVVTTIAGITSGGFSDGAGSTAKFSTPCGIAIDSNGALYVADANNNRIRKITIQ